jgi:hypothetical protein
MLSASGAMMKLMAVNTMLRNRHIAWVTIAGMLR